MKNLRLTTKGVVALMASTLLLGGAIGGTMAWLTAETSEVTNTFTVGDINIDLWESSDGEGKRSDADKVITRGDIKILPGNDIKKNPTATVLANSEDCWLFVTVTEENWPTVSETVDGKSVKKVNYGIEGGWTELESASSGNTKVYYRTVDATKADVDFPVLNDSIITVSDNLEKADFANFAKDDNGKLLQPQLIFQAFAIQRDANINTVETAWDNVSNLASET